MKKSTTLVFDIGKTTKKALLFDHSFRVLEEKTITLQEYTDDDGFPCENLALLTKWVTDTFGHYVTHPLYQITHLNFSAYGASLVSLDEHDEAILPFYNYLKPYPEEVTAKFHSLYNADQRISERTASPWLGMLNSGLQAFWLKEKKPELFRRIKTILHFPQYFPFRITGKKACDITSIGCHTLLWDYEQNNYHRWSQLKGIANLFPIIVPATTQFYFEIGGQHMTVGTGIHDSSAALMPYLVSMKEPFLLLSSGTWNICFNPFTRQPLTHEELKKDCLNYLTFEGNPVKASRIFLGHEHDVQQKALAAYFNVDGNAHKTILFDEKIYQRLSLENDSRKAFYPVAMEGTGPLYEKTANQTRYDSFADFAEAQHQLVRHLVQWQKLSIDLIDPEKEIKNIILVGGFSKSPLFIEIFKREINDRTLLLSDHPRASALGAAWLVHKPEAYRNESALLQVTVA